MQFSSRFLAVPLIAALCVPAYASPEEVCRQLGDALAREVAALESMVDAASTAEALPKLEAVLAELDAMDRSPEAENALWIYIDNTPGVKPPLIERVQCLCIQLQRLQRQYFYGNARLRELLTPQLPEVEEPSAPAAN